jgi:hypothetical protein
MGANVGAGVTGACVTGAGETGIAVGATGADVGATGADVGATGAAEAFAVGNGLTVTGGVLGRDRAHIRRPH